MPQPPSPAAQRRYISLDAAAEQMACSPRTIRRMVADGEIRAYRLGKRLLRLDLDEVEAALRPIPTTGHVA